MLFETGSPAAQKFVLRIGFAFALGASITGCTVGPKYQRPSVKLQPFHNAPSIETRTASHCPSKLIRRLVTRSSVLSMRSLIFSAICAALALSSRIENPIAIITAPPRG
ncbi:hypothetical protein JAO29_03640 [Edaphobacter sp. HDX4]